MNDFITFDQTKEKLNCSTPHIYWLIKNKHLTKYKQLGTPLFKRSEVEELLIPKPEPVKESA